MSEDGEEVVDGDDGPLRRLLVGADVPQFPSILARRLRAAFVRPARPGDRRGLGVGNRQSPVSRRVREVARAEERRHGGVKTLTERLDDAIKRGQLHLRAPGVGFVVAVSVLADDQLKGKKVVSYGDGKMAIFSDGELEQALEGQLSNDPIEPPNFAASVTRGQSEPSVVELARYDKAIKECGDQPYQLSLKHLGDREPVPQHIIDALPRFYCNEVLRRMGQPAFSVLQDAPISLAAADAAGISSAELAARNRPVDTSKGDGDGPIPWSVLAAERADLNPNPSSLDFAAPVVVSDDDDDGMELAERGGSDDDASSLAGGSSAPSASRGSTSQRGGKRRRRAQGRAARTPDYKYAMRRLRRCSANNDHYDLEGLAAKYPELAELDELQLELRLYHCSQLLSRQVPVISSTVVPNAKFRALCFAKRAEDIRMHKNRPRGQKPDDEEGSSGRGGKKEGKQSCRMYLEPAAKGLFRDCHEKWNTCCTLKFATSMDVPLSKKALLSKDPDRVFGHLLGTCCEPECGARYYFLILHNLLDPLYAGEDVTIYCVMASNRHFPMHPVKRVGVPNQFIPVVHGGRGRDFQALSPTAESSDIGESSGGEIDGSVDERASGRRSKTGRGLLSARRRLNVDTTDRRDSTPGKSGRTRRGPLGVDVVTPEVRRGRKRAGDSKASEQKSKFVRASMSAETRQNAIEQVFSRRAPMDVATELALQPSRQRYDIGSVGSTPSVNAVRVAASREKTGRGSAPVAEVLARLQDEFETTSGTAALTGFIQHVAAGEELRMLLMSQEQLDWVRICLQTNRAQLQVDSTGDVVQSSRHKVKTVILSFVMTVDKFPVSFAVAEWLSDNKSAESVLAGVLEFVTTIRRLIPNVSLPRDIVTDWEWAIRKALAHAFNGQTLPQYVTFVSKLVLGKLTLGEIEKIVILRSCVAHFCAMMKRNLTRRCDDDTLTGRSQSALTRRRLIQLTLAAMLQCTSTDVFKNVVNFATVVFGSQHNYPFVYKCTAALYELLNCFNLSGTVAADTAFDGAGDETTQGDWRVLGESDETAPEDLASSGAAEQEGAEHVHTIKDSNVWAQMVKVGADDFERSLVDAYYKGLPSGTQLPDTNPFYAPWFLDLLHAFYLPYALFYSSVTVVPERYALDITENERQLYVSMVPNRMQYSTSLVEEWYKTMKSALVPSRVRQGTKPSLADYVASSYLHSRTKALASSRAVIGGTVPLTSSNLRRAPIFSRPYPIGSVSNSAQTGAADNSPPPQDDGNGERDDGSNGAARDASLNAPLVDADCAPVVDANRAPLVDANRPPPVRAVDEAIGGADDSLVDEARRRLVSTRVGENDVTEQPSREDVLAGNETLTGAFPAAPHTPARESPSLSSEAAVDVSAATLEMSASERSVVASSSRTTSNASTPISMVDTRGRRPAGEGGTALHVDLTETAATPAPVTQRNATPPMPDDLLPAVTRLVAAPPNPGDLLPAATLLVAAPPNPGDLLPAATRLVAAPPNPGDLLPAVCDDVALTGGLAAALDDGLFAIVSSVVNEIADGASQSSTTGVPSAEAHSSTLPEMTVYRKRVQGATPTNRKAKMKVVRQKKRSARMAELAAAGKHLGLRSSCRQSCMDTAGELFGSRVPPTGSWAAELRNSLTKADFQGVLVAPQFWSDGLCSMPNSRTVVSSSDGLVAALLLDGANIVPQTTSFFHYQLRSRRRARDALGPSTTSAATAVQSESGAEVLEPSDTVAALELIANAPSVGGRQRISGQRGDRDRGGREQSRLSRRSRRGRGMLSSTRQVDQPDFGEDANRVAQPVDTERGRGRSGRRGRGRGRGRGRPRGSRSVSNVHELAVESDDAAGPSQPLDDGSDPKSPEADLAWAKTGTGRSTMDTTLVWNKEQHPPKAVRDVRNSLGAASTEEPDKGRQLRRRKERVNVFKEGRPPPLVRMSPQPTESRANSPTPSPTRPPALVRVSPRPTESRANSPTPSPTVSLASRVAAAASAAAADVLRATSCNSSATSDVPLEQPSATVDNSSAAGDMLPSLTADGGVYSHSCVRFTGGVGMVAAQNYGTFVEWYQRGVDMAYSGVMWPPTDPLPHPSEVERLVPPWRAEMETRAGFEVDAPHSLDPKTGVLIEGDNGLTAAEIVEITTPGQELRQLTVDRFMARMNARSGDGRGCVATALVKQGLSLDQRPIRAYDPVVQLLHMTLPPAGGHYYVVARDPLAAAGNQLLIYDSLPIATCAPSVSLIESAASTVRLGGAVGRCLTLRLVDVTEQSTTSNACGVHACLNVWLLINRLEPNRFKVIADEMEMRRRFGEYMETGDESQLKACFENFASVKNRRIGDSARTYLEMYETEGDFNKGISVDCMDFTVGCFDSCSRPMTITGMLPVAVCRVCANFFHKSCLIGVPNSCFVKPSVALKRSSSSSFVCPSCIVGQNFCDGPIVVQGRPRLVPEVWQQRQAWAYMRFLSSDMVSSSEVGRRERKPTRRPPGDTNEHLFFVAPESWSALLDVETRPSIEDMEEAVPAAVEQFSVAEGSFARAQICIPFSRHGEAHLLRIIPSESLMELYSAMGQHARLETMAGSVFSRASRLMDMLGAGGCAAATNFVRIQWRRVTVPFKLSYRQERQWVNMGALAKSLSQGTQPFMFGTSRTEDYMQTWISREIRRNKVVKSAILPNPSVFVEIPDTVTFLSTSQD